MCEILSQLLQSFKIMIRANVYVIWAKLYWPQGRRTFFAAVGKTFKKVRFFERALSAKTNFGNPDFLKRHLS